MIQIGSGAKRRREFKQLSRHSCWENGIVYGFWCVAWQNHIGDEISVASRCPWIVIFLKSDMCLMDDMMSIILLLELCPTQYSTLSRPETTVAPMS